MTTILRARDVQSNGQSREFDVPLSDLPTKLGIYGAGGRLQAGLFGDSFSHLEVKDQLPTSAAGGGNTGSASVSSVGAESSAVPGNWIATFTSTTLYTLVDPNGKNVGTGTANVQFVTAPRTLTITISTGAQIGDTFTINVPTYRWFGYDQSSRLFWANAANGFPYQITAQCGVSSDTTSMQLARFGTGTAADPYIYPTVDLWLWQSPIVNDAGAARTFDAIRLDAIAILDNLRSNGAKVIACSSPAVTSLSADAKRVVARFNAWLSVYCQAQRNVFFFNQKRAFTDPATGLYRTNYAISDFIHPSYMVINGTRDLATLLATITPPCDTTDVDISTPNLYGNGALTGSAAGTTSVNTAGSIAPTGITGTAMADMVCAYVRATGTATATVAAQTGKFIDNGQILTIATSASRDGAGMRFGGDGVAGLGRWDQLHALSTAVNKGQKYIPGGADANRGFYGLVALYTTNGTTSGTEPTYPTSAGAAFTDGTAAGVMVPLVGPAIWRASYYMGAGVVFFTSTNSNVYFQVTTAGATGGSIAAGFATATVGQSVTDGTLTALAIAVPTYGYKAQIDYTLSGLNSSKGVGLYFQLQIFDTAVAILDQSGNHVCGPFYDVSGTISPPSFYLPPAGQLQTPVSLLKPFKQVRYCFQDLLLLGDASQTGLVLTAYRPQITQVFPAATL